MQDEIELRIDRNHSFIEAIFRVRPKIAVTNAVLILGTVFPTGILNGYEFIAILSYFLLNLLLLGLPPFFRSSALRILHLGLIVLDLGLTGYFIMKTGGTNSELSLLMFIPPLVVAIRGKLKLTLSWCSLIAGILLAVALLSETFNLKLFIRISYIYLFGIVSNYLIQKTYITKEELSVPTANYRKDFKGLDSFLKEVSRYNDIEQIFQYTLKTISQNCHSSMVAVMILDEQGVLAVYDNYGWEAEWLEYYHRRPLNSSSLTLAPILVFKEPLLCPEISKHPELLRTFEHIPIVSLYAFPLIVDNEVIGAILIGNSESGEMPVAEVRILTSIANQAGVAIQHFTSIHQEKQKADTDGLTGLYNRRYFNEQMEELVYEAQKIEKPLSLILIDVDNFKQYNDTYGHPAGDFLLKKLAEILTREVRSQDIVARYGGEEFVVILRNTENQVAFQIGERIRSAIEILPSGLLKCPVTISAGVGTLPDHAKDRISLLEVADKSLYRAKNIGKNRICNGYDTIKGH